MSASTQDLEALKRKIAEEDRELTMLRREYERRKPELNRKLREHEQAIEQKKRDAERYYQDKLKDIERTAQQKNRELEREDGELQKIEEHIRSLEAARVQLQGEFERLSKEIEQSLRQK